MPVGFCDHCDPNQTGEPGSSGTSPAEVACRVSDGTACRSKIKAVTLDASWFSLGNASEKSLLETELDAAAPPMVQDFLAIDWPAAFADAEMISVRRADQHGSLERAGVLGGER